jgi:hypothetical protein
LQATGNHLPLGAEKWMTFPSLLNMLTSSMAWMGCTLSFLRAPWSFLSSVPELLWTFLTFLRGVPLPLCTNISCVHRDACTARLPHFVIASATDFERSGSRGHGDFGQEDVCLPYTIALVNSY